MDESALDDMALRAARTKRAAALFRAELGSVLRHNIATPVECANAMMSTSVIAAFLAAAGEESSADAINACIAEVTQVINRHVMAFMRHKKGGAK